MGNGGDLDSLMFQHTAARRRLDETDRNRCRLCSFNTQPPEGGWRLVKVDFTVNDGFQHTAARRRLVPFAPKANRVFKFQHTAARRRLVEARIVPDITLYVSTHSRPKAAGFLPLPNCLQVEVSTHSRPKAAGIGTGCADKGTAVSTHSRPKAAGLLQQFLRKSKQVSTHSRPKAAGWLPR